MSTRWRVIDLTEFSGEVASRSGRIVAGGREFPLSDVGCILVGPETYWSAAVVSRAAKYDVPILTCDWRGVPIAATLPWSSNTRVAARHLAQAALSQPRMKSAWQRIVQAKIRGQAANLPDGKVRDSLNELAQKVRSGDPLNFEARAARMYWSRVFPDESFSRDPQGEGRNLLLNYGYGVLRGMTIRSVCVAGLAPALGVFHRNRANAFALADDLIEPFRPAVDYAVASLPTEASLADPDVKRHLVSVLGLPMRQAGASVGTSINDLGQQYSWFVEGDRERLTIPSWLPSNG